MSSRAPFAMPLTAFVSALLAALMLLSVAPAPAAAQGNDDVRVMILLVPEEGAGRTEQTIIAAGLRRGARSVARLDDEHPADRLSNRQPPDYLFEALEEPDLIAELIAQGDAGEAERRARDALELFESNLGWVKRSQLARTYTLLGIAQCMQRERRACRESFRRVVTFREAFFYDPERYPMEFEPIFTEVQLEAVDTGLRGSVEVVTEPAGAEVFVDGRSYGPSPALVEGLLVGDHYVTVKAIGFEKEIQRITVMEDYQETYEVVLETSDKSLLVTQEMERMPAEFGEPQAGEAIRSLRINMGVDQAIVGSIRPAGEGQVEVTLYLYDLRTRHLLAEESATLPLDPRDTAAAEAMLISLYDGVDLEGNIEAPDEGPNFEQMGPIWKQWWFWTAAGVLVVAGVILTAFIASQGEEQLPPGWYQAGGMTSGPIVD